MIAFPKTGAGADPVFRSPSASSPDVLREYGLAPLPKQKPDSEGGPASNPGEKGAPKGEASPPIDKEQLERMFEDKLGELPHRFQL